MILATHALAGAVIGKNIDNPGLIIILSLAVHFLMDAFRHGEYVEVFSKNTSLKNSGWKVALDLIIGFTVILLIAHFQKLETWQIKNIALGAISSVFPDFITSIYWKFRWRFLEKYYAFHSWLHKYPRFAKERQWTLRNALNDIIISLACVVILFFL